MHAAGAALYLVAKFRMPVEHSISHDICCLAGGHSPLANFHRQCGHLFPHLLGIAPRTRELSHQQTHALAHAHGCAQTHDLAHVYTYAYAHMLT
eukprot:1012839-Pleurochrysis_carterae.AAC.2